MRFFVGLHQPSDAKHFERCMVSVNRLWTRVSLFEVDEWMLDSSAFMRLKLDGCYPYGPERFAERIHYFKRCGRLAAAVTEDYMCEPFMLARTGLTVAEHQRLTIERYDALRTLVQDVYILPVLQGYRPSEYVDHIRQYGDRLSLGMWVGVGSVCKRNADPQAIAAVLHAIHAERPDLRLHGFGVKETALASSFVRDSLYSADSMAWSYAARRDGRNANDWREAHQFERRVIGQRVRLTGFQPSLLEVHV